MPYDVIEARYLGGHRIWLRFRDGTAGEIDLAAGTEARTALAGRPVQRDEPRIERTEQNAVAAGCVWRRLVHPRAHGPAVGDRMAAHVEPGVERPALGASGGIQRKHAVERRAVVQRAAGHDGRADERGRPVRDRVLGDALVKLHIAGAVVARAMLPGDGELADVGAVDLPGGRVVTAAGLCAIGGPLDVGLVGRGGEGQNDGERERVRDAVWHDALPWRRRLNQLGGEGAAWGVRAPCGDGRLVTVNGVLNSKGGSPRTAGQSGVASVRVGAD